MIYYMPRGMNLKSVLQDFSLYKYTRTQLK
jgi:hypothetical protein